MTSIVFMGTPDFAANILTGVIDAGYDVKAVVTQPDRRVGRKHVLTPTPVKKVALDHGIEVLQPEKISGSSECQRVIDLQPDLIVTAAFGQFLPMKLINAAKIAAVNVHGSLLPKYRGGAPIQHAIMNGDSKTGVSIIYMVKKMDAGAILKQAEMPITSNDDAGSIFEKMSDLGRDTLLQLLPDLIAGNVHPVVQNEDEVVFSPTISSEEEELHLKQTAHQIDWQVRALRPAPGAYFKSFKGKRTKIWDVTVVDEQTDLSAGTVVEVGKHQLKVAAADGTVYQINRIQPAGKPQMDITAYLNGVGQGIKAGQELINEEND